MATNNYYDHTTWPAVSSSGASSSAREELEKIETAFDDLQSDIEDGSIWGTWTDEYVLAYNASSGEMEPRSITGVVGGDTGEVRLGASDTMEYLLPKLQYMGLI